ncbi:MAG: YdiU family protein [Cytophagales bacterium]|nr:MAG: YdiU family protein [Cytophagales bacterium]
MNSKDKQGWNFDNSYIKLPSILYSLSVPTPVSKPDLLLFNDDLAKYLGINFKNHDKEYLAQYLTGNMIIEGAQPLAQAYAGHQFGHFTKLGDGRAILLGEHINPEKIRFDIQLKGAGETQYSRRGDGRATLRSMLREYIISEAMHGLRIPTSRSLAVVTTGDEVYREQVHEGAILTRIASSHIRVGTFEYISNFLPVEILKTFQSYVIQRHYPELVDTQNPSIELLKSVMLKQIDLVIDWMRVGFIHGVMNTDNMSIAGETFDYGPCAFMNAYHPNTVFSSIDTQGRYAFGNQARIAHWNITRFAETLIPLIHDNSSEAIQMAEDVLNSFPLIYNERWTRMMMSKIGIALNINSSEEIFELIEKLLAWMIAEKADYTNTFLQLTIKEENFKGIYASDDFKVWYNEWNLVLKKLGINHEMAIETMNYYNPQFIPRNHIVEKILDEVSNDRDFTLFNQTLAALKNPYQYKVEYDFLRNTPTGSDLAYKTYCGT